MLGILTAILAALLQAIGDIGKKKLTKVVSPYLVIWLPICIALLINFIYLLIFGFPTIQWSTMLPFLIGGIFFSIFVEISFVKAISSAELSLIMPFTAFLPIVAIIFAGIFLGEIPSWFSIFGIIIVLIGSWIIFADSENNLSTFKELKEKFLSSGPRYILEMAVWNAFFVLMFRYGSKESSSVFFATAVLLGEWLCFLTYFLIKKTNPFRALSDNLLLASWTGFFWGIGITLVYVSMNLTLIAYAMAANRIHAVFVVLLSSLILKEGELKKRLPACILMVAGVIVVLLGR
ncbi:MAG: DMT family transporter [bacterium]|nr:DMT family transporter [bacterium]